MAEYSDYVYHGRNYLGSYREFNSFFVVSTAPGRLLVFMGSVVLLLCTTYSTSAEEGCAHAGSPLVVRGSCVLSTVQRTVVPQKKAL